MGGRLDLPTAEARTLALPTSYLEFLDLVGPGEGFIGHEYLRLFAVEQLTWVNQAYAVEAYLPGHLLFGSNGCGEAYVFAQATTQRRVLKIPFVPLDMEYADGEWDSFDEFLFFLVNAPAQDENSSYPETPNPEAIGKELHEIQPIALGGDASDPRNRAFVPVPQHCKLVTYWNKTFRAIRSRAKG